MGLVTLIWRHIWYRKALSLLTVVSVSITVALLVFLLLCRTGVEQGAEKGYGPFDVVVGADGSVSQLVLSTFYHVGAPTGNIPLDVFERLSKDAQADAAFAMTAGDNLNGYPIVGIDPNYFAVRYGDRKLSSGKLYGKLGEVTIGWHVARALGLRVGDTFKGAHGLVHEAGHAMEEEEGQEVHDEHDGFVYTIAGILPRLNSPDDRAVFTTMDYAWAVHRDQTGSHRQVTSILVKPKSLAGAQALKQEYDKLDNVQAAFTSKAVADVVNMVDRGADLLTVVTLLCVALSAVTILLSLVAAIKERQKDVGLLRLIGKKRSFIGAALIGEGLILTGIGLIIGMSAGHLGASLASGALFDATGIQVGSFAFEEFYVIAGTMAAGLLASAGPSFRVYRVNPLQLFRA
ncbi:ABC transporter permease [Paenibacillus sp. MBLB4367]|uniref:ABC transporter permease n=1 Tax=Paenibacillus sp. MBLB4367 TaxID=3384767 RepID=UPI003907EEF6